MAEKNFLNFNLSAEEIKLKAMKFIDKSTKIIDEIVKKEPSYKNTIIPYSEHEADLMLLFYNLALFNDVSGNELIRESSEFSQNMLYNYYNVQIMTRRDLYECFMQILEKESSELSKVDLRYIRKYISEFERNGLKLSDESHKEIKALKQKITLNNMTFSNNLVKFTTETELWFSEKELEGCGRDFFERLEKKKIEDVEKFKLSMKAPDLREVLVNCKVSETRRKMITKSQQQAIIENTKFLEENIQLRKKLAEKLEVYDSDYTKYRLEIRMGKSTENVMKFLDEVYENIKGYYEKDFEAFRKLKYEEIKELDPQTKLKLEDINVEKHDLLYYSRLRKEKEFDLDYEFIKSYFPHESTILGVLDFYGDLFGVDFKRIENPPKHQIWHNEVYHFHVIDRESKEIISMIYLDLFPRDNKYQHFCVRELQPSCSFPSKNNKRQIPISVMLCNFSRGLGFGCDEIRTFMHELGHMMHICCSQTKYAKFSGYLVVFDFLEAPSMALENFSCNAEVLRRISSHYETNKPLDYSICKKLADAARVNHSLRVLGLIWRAKFDILSYFQNPIDTKKLFNSIQEEYMKTPIDNSTSGASSFSHLMHPIFEYDVGYYTYLWCEVYGYDIYSEIVGEWKIKGVEKCFEKGKKLRTSILQHGGEKDEIEMLEDFLGRKASKNPYFENFVC